MLQTSSFGNFNRDIRRYPRYVAKVIDTMATEIRIGLEAVSCYPPRNFYDTEAYIDSVVQGYRDLVRITRLYR